MALFVSTFVNKIDRKGRVSVPASFRAVLTEMDTQNFAAFPSFTAPAIEGWPTAKMEELALAANNSLDMFSPEQDDLNMLIFSSTQQFSFDSEGRIALPEEFLAHTGIVEQAAFVGKGRTFQIWRPETLAEHLAETRKRALANPPRISLNSGRSG